MKASLAKIKRLQHSISQEHRRSGVLGHVLASKKIKDMLTENGWTDEEYDEALRQETLKANAEKKNAVIKCLKEIYNDNNIKLRKGHGKGTDFRYGWWYINLWGNEVYLGETYDDILKNL